MKKLVIAVLFVVAVVGMASAATLGLQGTIPKTANIAITPTAAATALALQDNTYASTKLKVGDATVTTNCKAWTISASSTQTWELWLAGVSGDSDVPYTFYITADGVPTTIYVTSPSDLSESFTNNKGDTLVDLMITYTGQPTFEGGTYTETVTVTVAAN